MKQFLHQVNEEVHLTTGAWTIKVERIPEKNWEESWKTYYHPIRLTDRVIVEPPWEAFQGDADVRIVMDPGMAFGTGTHATTALCVQMIDRFLKPEDRVIDVGTGSGILAIAAAQLGAHDVRAYDIDEVAVKVARQNVAENKVDSLISVEKNHLLHGIEDRAQLIVANILAEIIVDLAPDVARILAPDGVFIASGIIEDKKQMVADSLRGNGLDVFEEALEEGWVALVSRKGSK
nr:50S ribosomal protein L11 methyltransferase [Litoribacterium kuwaitense]